MMVDTSHHSETEMLDFPSAYKEETYIVANTDTGIAVAAKMSA